MYTLGISSILNSYMRQLEILTKIGADRLGVYDNNINSADANETKLGNVVVIMYLVGKVGKRVRDF